MLALYKCAYGVVVRQEEKIVCSVESLGVGNRYSALALLRTVQIWLLRLEASKTTQGKSSVWMKWMACRESVSQMFV